MSKVMVLAVTATVAVGLSISPAMAGEYVVTANGGPYTGAVHAELEASNVTFTTGAGQPLTCNQSHLTGSITSSEVGPGSTVTGSLSTLTLANNGNSFYPSTIPGMSSFETEVSGMPYAINLDATNHVSSQLVLNDVSLTMHFNAFIGRIECSLEASTFTSNVVGDEIRVVNQALISDSGFPCPSAVTFSAVYDLRTKPADVPVTLTEQ